MARPGWRPRTHSCAVTGVDLSPDFVQAGQALTERVGLAATVQHHLGSGDALDFADGSFDRAMLVHVGINIPDKGAVFAEVRRVLQPGGLFGLYEQVRVGEGEPTYPLPWAEDERSSFVESLQTYGQLLERAGFTVESTENRRRRCRSTTRRPAAESADRLRIPFHRADRQQHRRRCGPASWRQWS